MLPAASTYAATTATRKRLRVLQRQKEQWQSQLEGQDSANDQRRQAAVKDFRLFARACLPHRFTAPPSKMHDWVFEAIPPLLALRAGQHIALAAPRGEAKSTMIALALLLWMVATDRKRYILVVMNTREQAILALEDLKLELESNPWLEQHFPACYGAPSGGDGREWARGKFITANGARLEGVGAGQKLRGRRFHGMRPDLVILDDVENDDAVINPQRRARLKEWLYSTILPLGSADGTMDCLLVGTVLHHDSLLANLLDDPHWQSKRFQAIMRPPDRQDLWQQWEKQCVENPDAAAGFLDTHRDAMHAGAEVSWSAMRPLEALMKIRQHHGHIAFAKEYQNEPVPLEDAQFQHFQFWEHEQPDLLMFGALDPSLGRSATHGDYSAIVIGGIDRKTGRMDVMVADLARRPPDDIIADIVRHQQRWNCYAWFVETVQFQEFLRAEIVKRAARQGVALSARAIVPTRDKNLRIQSLQPPVADGRIRFHPSQIVLLDQLRYWPSASHDDGPDALAMLWSNALLAMTAVTPRGSGQIRGKR